MLFLKYWGSLKIHFIDYVTLKNRPNMNRKFVKGRIFRDPVPSILIIQSDFYLFKLVHSS